MSAAPPSSLNTDSTSTFPSYHYLSTTLHSFSFDNPSYVMHLTQTSPHHIASASSDHIIKTYHLTNHQLICEQTLRGHTDTIHDLVYMGYTYIHPNAQPPQHTLLLSASADGTVKAWDERSGKDVATWKSPNREPFFSCHSNGDLLVAGSEGPIFVWDTRSSKLISTIEDFHTEEVTQLRFHPFSTSHLLSASLDSLLCYSHINTSIDPEDWLLTVSNIENSINKIGWFGPEAEYAYAISSIETLSLWFPTKGLKISDFSTTRQVLSQSCHHEVDYVIDCHYDSQSQRLYCAAGGNRGGLLLSHVNVSQLQPYCSLNFDHTYKPGGDSNMNDDIKNHDIVTNIRNMPNEADESDPDTDIMDDQDTDVAIAGISEMGIGEDEMTSREPTMDDEKQEEEGIRRLDEKCMTIPGHVATIRAIVWEAQEMITGGEDGKLCVWSSDPSAKVIPYTKPTSSTPSSSPPSKQQRRRPDTTNGTKHRPY